MNNILEKLYSVTSADNIVTDEPMSRHTTFKVGGNADYFITPNGTQEAADIVRLLLSEKIPFYIIGNGSNVLASDNGFRGCIVCLSKGIDDISIDGDCITAEAGAMLSRVCKTAMENSLDGMVFASGIPGSVGGAIVMNAGAYGGEMKDLVERVRMLDMTTGEIVDIPGCDMQFGYRTSIVKNHPYLVLSVIFKLTKATESR